MPAIKSRGLARVICLSGVVAAAALSSAGASPQTQDLKGKVLDPLSKPLEAAVCTLAGRTLSDEGLTVTTDENGEFLFPGLAPATYELTCAAVGFEPVVQKGLKVSADPVPPMTLILPVEVIRRKVEVTAQSGLIGQQASIAPSLISSRQLRALPLTEQKFKAALPLVPGVVRTPDGKINIKGSIENQGMLLVDSAETVDPVSGAFSIDVPIDAVESLEVYKSAYRAEYGRFSGGLTSIQTKAPSGQWHLELNDLIPSLRVRSGHISGIEDDRPRLSFGGPLIKNRLSFAESFTYDYSRQPVRGLAWPNNETKKQGFTSFTNFQYLFSASHLLTMNVNVFPSRLQFADISSLVPQTASSNYGQQGFSGALTDRYLFHAGGILTTLLKFTKFDSNAYGQGPVTMRITPEGRGGNFFNTWSRESKQDEILESYQFPQKQAWGRHEFKVGGSFIRRAFTGAISSHPIVLLREDGSLAERISFGRPASLNAEDTEAGGFIEDHWVLNDHLATDLGLRYSGQTIGEKAAFAPRFGVVYSPRASGKTIFRGGIGIFYDRVPLLAGNFNQHPPRTIRFFDPNAQPLGPALTFPYRYERIDPRKGNIVPSGNHLDSTPHNATWNLEADRELRPKVLLRFSYLSSRTHDMFVIEPRIISMSPNLQDIFMSNAGGSRYHEFESTIRFRAKEGVDVNTSYVHSLGRGDLNTLSSLFVPFEQPVIRQNFFASLDSNVPNRLVTWGRFQLPRQIALSPVLDVHSGFPYSPVDVLQNYVGTPNSQRFPAFASLDLKLTKDFRVPFVPILKKHKLRGGLQIFNLTNHANPRDVFNTVVSPDFGHFAGLQHRFYDFSFDIVD